MIPKQQQRECQPSHSVGLTCAWGCYCCVFPPSTSRLHASHTAAVPGMAEAQMQRGEEAQNEQEYQDVDSFQARRNAKKREHAYELSFASFHHTSLKRYSADP